MQKVKVKGHSIGSKVRVKTDGWTKGQTEAIALLPMITRLIISL